MLRNIILAFVTFFLITIHAYADPSINTFAVTSGLTTDGKIHVSATAPTTVQFKVTIGRAWNAGIYEGVSMYMYVILRSGTTEEVLTAAISVSGTDFNNGPFAEKRFSAVIPADRAGRTAYLKYSYNHPVTGQLVGPIYSTTYYYTTLTAPPPPSDGIDPSFIRIVPNQRNYSPWIKESDSNFECPAGTVMTYRHHLGDENGSTSYEYSTLKAVDYLGSAVAGTITVQVAGWSPWMKESNSNYYVPPGYVMIGRQHYGDENANTRYMLGIVRWNGVPTQVPQQSNYVTPIYIQTERDSNVWLPPATKVLIGRRHNNDENGETFYYFSTILATP